MKRINDRPVVVEPVFTTCGNETLPEVLTGELCAKAGDVVRRLGDRLAQEGS